MFHLSSIAMRASKILIKNLFLSFTCLGLTNMSMAQVNVSGIIETADGVPVPFANVLLLQPTDSSLMYGSISEGHGIFQLHNISEGSYLLYTSMVGYIPQYKNLVIGAEDQRLPPTVLIEETRELQGIIVSARKPLYEKQIDRLVVNVQSKITSSGKTALQILQSSPGVSVNPQNLSISMRGKEGVRVMINGKMNQMPMEAVVQMLDGMSAANIEKIELITMPPAKYDAEGNAGIINIVMADNPELGTSGNFGLTAGYNQKEVLGANFNLHHRKARFSYFLDYSILSDRNEEIWRENRMLADPSFTRSVLNDIRRDFRLTVQNLRAGLEYEFNSKTRIRALLTSFHRDWHTAGTTFINNQASPDSTILTDMNLVEDNIWKSIGGAVGYTHKINENQTISLDFDYLAYTNDNPSSYDNTVVQLGEPQAVRNQIEVSKGTPIRIKVLKMDYSNQLQDNFSIDLGIKATLSDFSNQVLVRNFKEEIWQVDPQFSNVSKLDEKISAAYISWMWHATKKLTLRGGLRYEYTDSKISTPEKTNLVDREFGNFFPGLHLAHQFSQESKLQLGYNRRINRPAFNNLAPFVYFVGPNSVYAGNPGLRTAVTDGVELNYQLKQWWISLNYSHTDNGMLGWQQPQLELQTNSVVFRPQNLDYIKTLSFSTGLSLTLTPWWEVQNDVTIFRQSFQTQHFEENFGKSFYNFRFNTTAGFTLPKQYTIELSGYYQNKNWDGVWMIEPRGQVDIGIRKKLTGNKGTLTLSFSDILGTNVWNYQAEFLQEGASLQGFWDTHVRSIKVTFNKSFGNKKLKSVDIDSGAGEERKRVN